MESLDFRKVVAWASREDTIFTMLFCFCFCKTKETQKDSLSYLLRPCQRFPIFPPSPYLLFFPHHHSLDLKRFVCKFNFFILILHIYIYIYCLLLRFIDMFEFRSTKDESSGLWIDRALIRKMFVYVPLF